MFTKWRLYIIITHWKPRLNIFISLSWTSLPYTHILLVVVVLYNTCLIFSFSHLWNDGLTPDDRLRQDHHTRTLYPARYAELNLFDILNDNNRNGQYDDDSTSKRSRWRHSRHREANFGPGGGHLSKLEIQRLGTSWFDLLSCCRRYF